MRVSKPGKVSDSSFTNLKIRFRPILKVYPTPSPLHERCRVAPLLIDRQQRGKFVEFPNRLKQTCRCHCYVHFQTVLRVNRSEMDSSREIPDSSCKTIARTEARHVRHLRERTNFKCDPITSVASLNDNSIVNAIPGITVKIICIHFFSDSSRPIRVFVVISGLNALLLRLNGNLLHIWSWMFEIN